MPAHHALLARVILASAAVALTLGAGAGCVERTLNEQTTGSPFGEGQEEDLCRQFCEKLEPCDEAFGDEDERCEVQCEDSRAEFEELRCGDVWETYMRCLYDNYECQPTDIDACTDEVLAFVDCFDSRPPEPERPGPGGPTDAP